MCRSVCLYKFCNAEGGEELGEKRSIILVGAAAPANRMYHIFRIYTLLPHLRGCVYVYLCIYARFLTAGTSPEGSLFSHREANENLCEIRFHEYSPREHTTLPFSSAFTSRHVILCITFLYIRVMQFYLHLFVPISTLCISYLPSLLQT